MLGSQTNLNFTFIYEKSTPLVAFISQANVKLENDFDQNNQNKDIQVAEPAQPKAPRQSKKQPNNSKKYFKALQTIRQISERYFLTLFQEDQERILGKIALMDNQGKRAALNESAAVVLFFQYFDQIRTTLNRQFCSRNGLSTTIFNKKYKVYHSLFVKDKQEEAINSQISQKQLTQNKEQILNSIKKPTIEHGQISNTTQAISFIYDYIFKSTFYQTNRRQIIEKLVLHYQNLDKRIAQQIYWIEGKGAKIYYIFHNILRVLKAGIAFKIYQTAVLRRTGIKLNQKDRKLVTKIFNDYYIERPIDLSQSYEQATFYSANSL